MTKQSLVRSGDVLILNRTGEKLFVTHVSRGYAIYQYNGEEGKALVSELLKVSTLA